MCRVCGVLCINIAVVVVVDRDGDLIWRLKNITMCTEAGSKSEPTFHFEIYNQNAYNYCVSHNHRHTTTTNF